MNLSFEVKLAEAVSPAFRVKTDGQQILYFENIKAPGSNYVLNVELLSEPEILKVAEILFEVYSSTSDQFYRSVWETDRVQQLNRDNEASHRFLKAVLSLKSSSIHKLLLLASGEILVTDKNVDLMVTLAQAKNETQFYNIDITDRRVYQFLQKVYFFPGVDKKTSTYNGIPERGTEKESLEFLTCLSAFLANDAEKVTLKEHLELDLSDAVATTKSLEDITLLQKIPAILFSDYRDIAESMTAKELTALSKMLSPHVPSGKFSKSMLQNRAKAMANQSEDQAKDFGLQFISKYLSQSEAETLSSRSAKELSGMLSANDLRSVAQPIFYAALAEVFAVKGEKKAFEVAKTLVHLKSSNGRNLRMYEATVAIILEALEPESDDYPFGWVAEMSEHSWVLSCHIERQSDYELKV